jgi:hypothetical protein
MENMCASFSIFKKKTIFSYVCHSVWICGILVWIRIRGSVPLTEIEPWIRNLAPDPDPALFARGFQDANKK